MALEANDLHDLVTEVRLLRAEFTMMKEALVRRDKNDDVIFERLRTIETDLAGLQAERAPRVSGWTIVAAVVAAIMAAVTFVEKLSI